MKVNSISNISNIYFKSNGQQIAPLSQQQQNKVNFEKEKMLAKRADSVDANPITSLGYKLYRTFRFISEHDSSSTTNNNSLNVIA